MASALKLPVFHARVLRQAYYRFSQSPEGKIILDDLRRKCFAEMPTYVKGDATETAYREGMRWVFLRITAFARLSLEELDAISQTHQETEY